MTGVLFGVPLVGARDIVIAAIEEACGQKIAGEMLLKGASAVVAGLAIVGMAAGLAVLLGKLDS